jgi:hypothetical protein
MAFDAFLKVGNGAKGFVTSTPEMVQAYLDVVAEEEVKLPPTAAKHKCNGDCLFLCHDEGGEKYIAPLTTKEATDYCDGTITKETLNSTKEYCVIGRKYDDPATTKYTLKDGALTVKTATVAPKGGAK